MKKLSYQLLILSVICMAGLSGCTNDENITEQGAADFTINVQTEEFTPETGTRTPVEEGYKTVFKGGEKIGITAVKNGAIYHGMDNVPFTYDAATGTWKPTDTGVLPQLYYYPGISYIAYYPYDAGMNGKSSELEMIDAFTPQTDQSTYANYTASDLMTGTGIVSESNGAYTITFNLQHRMSLITVKAQGYRYITTDGYEYSTPIADFNLKLNNTSIQPYNVEPYTYRCLVPPVNTPQKLNVNFTGTFGNPVSFEKTYTPLNDGEYYYTHLYNGTAQKTRDLQVGDYFYTDGSIMPQDVTTPPYPESCIGLIFKVGAYSGDVLADYEGSIEKIHGYVIGLKKTNSAPWGNTNDRSNTGANDYYRGYKNTQTLLAYYPNKNYAAQAADSYNTSYATPKGVSKWYFPAGNQILEAWNVRNNLNFAKVNGEIFYSGSGQAYYHTSTGLSSKTAKVLDMNGNSCHLGDLANRSNYANTRPIFTF